jgi:nitroimidazol reductase NimA-like FMN-containing flavoprotein (pyridoxamine 5'-phosphate oxidase superfamily)
MSAVEVDRNGLEVLGRDECIALLAGATFGRIAITSNALPVVLPVNYVLLDDRIVVRTGRGTKLDAATRNTVVAFEVDEIETVEQTGWSVVVTGVARALVAPDEIDDVSDRHGLRQANPRLTGATGNARLQPDRRAPRGEPGPRW